MKPIVLGIDPDTKMTGMAVVKGGARPELLWVGSAVASAKLAVEERIVKMVREVYSSLPQGQVIEIVCVEGQEKYPRDNVRPNDLIHLAQVAGAAAAAALAYHGAADLIIPTPRKWKGQVPKEIHQKRILAKVKHTPNLAGVPGAATLTKTQKGHVIDAIGLAIWAADRHDFEERTGRAGLVL